MQNKSNDYSLLKKSGNILWQLIQHKAIIIPACLAVWGFLSRTILRISESNNITLSLSILLIIELGLSILAIALSISCIIKINRNKPDLPPVEHMKKILMIGIKPKSEFTHNDYSDINSEQYFHFLYCAGYIFRNGFVQDNIGCFVAHKYKLTPKGKKWLKKQNLIA